MPKTVHPPSNGVTRTRHPPSNDSARHRWRRTAAWIVGSLFGLAILLSLAAEPFLRFWINAKLARLEGYQGEIAGVDISVLPARVGIEGLVLRERDAPSIQSPTLAIESAKADLEWSALLKGIAQFSVHIESARLNVIIEEDAKHPKPPGPEGPSWRDALKQLFPFRVSTIKVTRSNIHIADVAGQPPAEIFLERVSVTANGFSNLETGGDRLPVSLQAHGEFGGGGTINVKANLDPLSSTPRFNADIALEKLALPPLNNLLRRFADVDVSSGTFEAYIEAEARDRRYSGYLKPFLKDIDFRTIADRQDSGWQKLKEAAADVVAPLFESDERNKVATRIPFSGEFSNLDADLWTAFETFLQNAFIQALREGFARQPPSPG